jgi:Dolichyl-phosphate-mannose-protein mannosyltransferase
VSGAHSVELPVHGDRGRLLLLLATFERVFDEVSRYRVAIVLAFTVVYLIPTVLLARHKLFWDDEFFTVYFARIPTWNGLLQALSTGADQHPPSFYFLTHEVINLFGNTHVTVRLPAIVGYWLMCVCLYGIASYLLDRRWAIVALALPLTSPAYYYASEARGYGLMLGCSTAAFLCWFAATIDNNHRSFSIPLLALSLAAATGSHYYAVFCLFPLFAGELVRTAHRRRIDIAVWAAFLGVGAPLLLFSSTIRSARSYAGHFWAVPIWSDIFRFYPANLGATLNLLLGVIVIALLLYRGRMIGVDSDLESRAQSWHTIALAGFAMLPVVIMTAAKFVTHGYTERYALAALIGAFPLIACCLALVSGRHSLIAALAVVGCLIQFTISVWQFKNNFNASREDVSANIKYLKADSRGPVILSEVTVFHRVSFYAPRDLVRRLTYVADPDASVRYLGHDTVDRGLLDLRPWFPLNIVPFGEYLATHSDFMVYGYIGDWTWLAYELPKIADVSELLGRRYSRVLFSVKGARPPAGEVREPETPPHQMLYLKTPANGPPLCELYMAPGACPVLY